MASRSVMRNWMLPKVAQTYHNIIIYFIVVIYILKLLREL